jgi:hypothetical protein
MYLIARWLTVVADVVDVALAFDAASAAAAVGKIWCIYIHAHTPTHLQYYGVINIILVLGPWWMLADKNNLLMPSPSIYLIYWINPITIKRLDWAISVLDCVFHVQRLVGGMVAAVGEPFEQNYRKEILSVRAMTVCLGRNASEPPQMPSSIFSAHHSDLRYDVILCARTRVYCWTKNDN